MGYYGLKVCGVAAVIAFAACAPGAGAQEKSWKAVCQSVGGGGIEPLGDREGHAISVSDESCRLDGSLMSGGVSTGRVTWEWDKTNAVMISGGGIVRAPGGTLDFEITEGKLALTVVDGKVTGFTASGRGRYPAAFGAAASLAGKTFTYIAKPTGLGQWAVEGMIE